MRLPNKNFWKGKRVFVTGAEGFKGKWLVRWLLKMGAEIQTNGAFDICEQMEVERVMAEFKPEIAFLLAAVSTVQEAYENPIKTMRTNVVGTITMMEILRSIPSIKAIVNVTTDKVYHIEGIDRGYIEQDALGGLENYSVSKVCAEHISTVYQKTFRLPLATARAGNVIGGGDWMRSRIVPNYIYAHMEGTILDVNTNAVRPWQYVLDCLCGYLLLAEKLYDNVAYAGAWNFASNEFESKTVQWIVDEMNAYFTPLKYNLIDYRGYYETKNLRLSSEKAHKVLKWDPKYGMEEMIARTALWYQDYLYNKIPWEVLHDREIEEYMEYSL